VTDTTQTSNASFACIILAAGKGTRLVSAIPKAMHKVAEKPLLQHVIDACVKAGSSEIVIVAAPHDALTQSQAAPHTVAIQHVATGTGTAALEGVKVITGKYDKVLFLNADMPLLKSETIRTFAEQADPLSIMVMDIPDPRRFGRVVLDKNDKVVKIVEYKDATETERAITACNVGVYAIAHDKAEGILSMITNDNAAKEYYITDMVTIGNANKLSCGMIVAPWDEVASTNTRVELAELEQLLQNRLRRQFMDAGVTLIDPQTVFFSTDTKISNDVIIEPNVFIGPGVTIAKNVRIKAFSHIEGATIGEDTEIGPFARLRPGTIIEKTARIGNFVEIKKTTVGEGSKVSHFTYLGDATVGKKVNVGGFTVTCNYDGFNKAETHIKDNVFIGSNTILIAPVTIGENAMTAAGSVIAKDVAADDLAIARAEQITVNQGAKRFRDKRKK
jgi:bifunctional UDP-N-acetylglucosamine pyrophosphorylase/glucosamine-1-phosphate N-acetyltransferase